MKKQLIRMLLAIAVVISAVTIGMKTAKAATQGDWEYTVDENLQAKITAYYWNAPEMKGKSSDGFNNIVKLDVKSAPVIGAKYVGGYTVMCIPSSVTLKHL